MADVSLPSRRPLDEAGWQELRRHFSDEQVAGLLLCAAVLAGVGRMLSAAGFIEQSCDTRSRSPAEAPTD